MDKILAKLSPKEPLFMEKTPVNDGILINLSEQQGSLGKQKQLLNMSDLAVPFQTEDINSSAESSPLTTDLNLCPVVLPADKPQNKGTLEKVNTIEMLRLKQELVAANSRIALQEQELAQNRVIKHTLDQVMGPPSEADFGAREITEQAISNLQSAFNASTRPFNQRQEPWPAIDDAHSDISDILSTGPYNRSRGIWTTSQPTFGINAHGCGERTYRDSMLFSSTTLAEQGRNWVGRVSNQGAFVPTQRVLSGPTAQSYGFDGRYVPDQGQYIQGPGNRRSITQVNRGGSCFPPQNSPWGTFSAAVTSGPNSRVSNAQHLGPYQQVGVFQGVVPYQPRPIGTPLSPTAAEFTSAHSNAGSWSPSVSCSTFSDSNVSR